MAFIFVWFMIALALAYVALNGWLLVESLFDYLESVKAKKLKAKPASKFSSMAPHT